MEQQLLVLIEVIFVCYTTIDMQQTRVRTINVGIANVIVYDVLQGYS